MKPLVNLTYLGQTRAWWLVLAVGILLVLGGFAYWFWPVIGYAVSSQIFGWLMILAGIISLCVSAGRDRPRGWGWWLVCGIINMFVGFMLVRSVILSEMVFPFFIALVFAVWGVGAIFSSISQRQRRYWWLYLINGILMIILSYLLVEAGYVQDMMMTTILTSIAFIYWGFSLSMLSCDMRPENNNK